MSVLRHNQVKDEEEVYFNFINSIKSEVTKKVYEDGIKLYLKYCNLSKLSELLNVADPQKKIIEYIMSLRKKGLSSNSSREIPAKEIKTCIIASCSAAIF